jgi:hypothetical protein
MSCLAGAFLLPFVMGLIIQPTESPERGSSHSSIARTISVTTITISRAAAFGADQPVAPIENGRFGAVPSGHFGGIGLDLMSAVRAPHGEANASSSCAAERHGWAGVRPPSRLIIAV